MSMYIVSAFVYSFVFVFACCYLLPAFCFCLCLFVCFCFLLCRANGAEDDSPGQRPGYGAPYKIARPERAEGSAPLQGANQSVNTGTQGAALG